MKIYLKNKDRDSIQPHLKHLIFTARTIVLSGTKEKYYTKAKECLQFYQKLYKKISQADCYSAINFTKQEMDFLFAEFLCQSSCPYIEPEIRQGLLRNFNRWAKNTEIKYQLSYL